MERVGQDELTAKASLAPSLNASFNQGFNFGQSLDPFTNTFATDRVQYGNYGANLSFDFFRGLSKLKRLKGVKPIIPFSN